MDWFIDFYSHEHTFLVYVMLMCDSRHEYLKTMCIDRACSVGSVLHYEGRLRISKRKHL